ncbi:beta-xylosidase [Novosphingobium chloroacetimidivorans]|uniref:Beta-xylosidase n=1 Tax=Novosphingobium chloroacetimidivorans TaxID=1428314 RepID=A0A7W7KD55_9SPHN|nr:family 43 glycosylhydrolase [Novosphingobium chloroacetimidivorans]MBB4860665.1 beta-xylosidase [Novosphingobium chloroacetimidivorans]
MASKPGRPHGVEATRRELLALGGSAGAGLLIGAGDGRAQTIANPGAASSGGWNAGIEGQRKADLGATFLNPIMAGDHPDPSILKDGRDYYMTFSTFEAYPGLAIWHSRDLVNWRLLASVLHANIGSVWAPELCRHGDRYFIYVSTRETKVPGTRTTSWVIWADKIEGPWSDPVDLDWPDHIDPGHAVGDDGSRWLFLSGGDRVRLAADGLSRVGPPEHVYDHWKYPEDWEVEAAAPEGPKVVRHGEYYYLVLAVGGTAGPPTGHMVIAARSRSLDGPWQDHPRNPLVRTADAREKWWSRGHATLVEGPAGDWWAVYHGYENGYYTLGRQTLLAPVRWTDDGWFSFGGGDLSQPLPKPAAGQLGPHGLALSDDFSTDKYGSQWNFFSPSEQEPARLARSNGVLHLACSGTAPANSRPLLFTAGDQAYEFDCEIDCDTAARGGLLLFYDDRLYCGLSVDAEGLLFHKYGIEHSRVANAYGRRLFMRLRNRNHIVSLFLSQDRQTWRRFEKGTEVSGYHHNVRGGFLALKPGLYAAGTGEVRFRDFRYRALASATAES